MKHLIIEKKTILSIDAHGNCKPVYCISNGKIYASVKEAAQDIGVSNVAMSSHLSGRYRTVKHMHFCLVSDMTAHIAEIAAETENLMKAKVEAEAKMVKVQQFVKEFNN